MNDSLDLDCPDPELEICSEDQTCCINKYDEMGCCPYKNGICCPGGQCCPVGMECNLDKMRCDYVNVNETTHVYWPTHTAGSDNIFVQIYMDALPGVPGVS